MKIRVRLWFVGVLCLVLLLCGCARAGQTQAALPSPAAAPTESPEPAASEAPQEVPEITAPASPAVEETADDEARYAPYAELVEKTARGLRSGWADTTPEALGVSDVFKRTEDLRLGWLRLDINGDGTDELLFGQITEEGEASPVFDIFCLLGTELSHPASGWEFNRWYLLEDGMLMNEVSGTGFDLTRSAYGYFNGALVPARSSADRSEYRHLAFTDFGELPE